AYAYLTDTDRMAFLCPQYHNARLPVQHTGAEIKTVSPDGDFTCGEYESLIRSYILETLTISYPELHVFDAAADAHLCLSGVSDIDLTEVHDTNSPFSISDPATFADRVIAAIAFASYGPNKPELETEGRWTKTRIKEACAKTDEEDYPKYPQHETTCVPIYDPEGNDDHGNVTLHFLKSDQENTSVSTEGPIPLM